MGNRAKVTRVGSHLVVWTLVVVPTILELVRGWRPLNDDATISFRAYQVLSAHPPLLGQYQSVSAGAAHIAYDLGPLQYVLLSIPTHLDHLHGLWGAAICWGVVLSLAIEAIWSTGKWLGCLVVALGVANLAVTVPSLFGNEMWNPNFGVVFLFATIVIAVAVALGSFGWWPVLVFTASVTMQTELFYALVAAVVLMGAPILAWWRSGRPERFRWLGVGVGVGVLCWLPTVIQELANSPGNVSALLLQSHHASMGAAFGFRSLGRIIWPPTPISSWQAFGSFNSLSSTPVICGVVVLVGLALITELARRKGLRDLVVTAFLALACALCVVVDFAVVPKESIGALTWLDPILWVVGFFVWVVVGWGVVEAARVRVKVPAIAVGLVCVLLGAIGLWRLPSWANVDTTSNAQVASVVRTVEARIRPGPVNLTFSPPPTFPLTFSAATTNHEFLIGQAILWQLTAAGYEPLLRQPFFTLATGITYPRDPSPTVTVFVDGNELRGVRS